MSVKKRISYEVSLRLPELNIDITKELTPSEATSLHRTLSELLNSLTRELNIVKLRRKRLVSLETEKKVLDILEERPSGFTIAEIAKKLSVDDSTAQKALRHLWEIGEIERKRIEKRFLYLKPQPKPKEPKSAVIVESGIEEQKKRWIQEQKEKIADESQGGDNNL